MPVRIVTDSTGSLPAEVVEAHGIAVVPLHVRFGATDYTEGEDLSAEEFYRLLETLPDHPATSQPNPAEFGAVYDRVASDGDPIVSIHISSKLSKTVESARQAAAARPDLRIETVDSGSVSMALGLQVVEAAKAAAGGAGPEEIVELVAQLGPRSHCAFVVPTLEYLRRGGRIGGAAAFLGSLLKLKPVLHVEDGQVEPVTRVRSFSKAHVALQEYVRERAPNGVHSAAILHTAAEDHRQRIETDLLGEFPPAEELFPDVIIGPVIGAHTGGGAFAIAFIANP